VRPRPESLLLTWIFSLKLISAAGAADVAVAGAAEAVAVAAADIEAVAVGYDSIVAADTVGLRRSVDHSRIDRHHNLVDRNRTDHRRNDVDHNPVGRHGGDLGIFVGQFASYNRTRCHQTLDEHGVRPAFFRQRTATPLLFRHLDDLGLEIGCCIHRGRKQTTTYHDR